MLSLIHSRNPPRMLNNNSTYIVNKLKITFVNLNDKYVMPKSVSNDDVEKLVDLLGVFDGH